MNSDIEIDAALTAKLETCRRLLRESGAGGAVVAYSGGVDSTLLLALALEQLPGGKVAAVMAVGPAMAEFELHRGRRIAASLGVETIEMPVDPLTDPEFLENTPRRCYFCKRGILASIRRIADQRGLATIMTGSNADDSHDHRPGSLAEQEFAVVRPLKDAGMTKADIRSVARAMGLENWNAPSAACLISRIPYHESITVERLHRIDQAEAILRDAGFTQIRVRDHGEVARIEVLPEQLQMLLDRRQAVAEAIKALGYTFVTMDLTGFVSGSMNANL